MNKANEIVAAAERASRTVGTWADLSNLLFDPVEGLVTKAFPTTAERIAFSKTEGYARLRKLIDEAQDRTDLVEGAAPQKSGRFVTRLPRSLHAALEKEAATEGVSLNQLVVAKLAVQLDNLGRDPLGAVIRAFAELRDGYSADRVVADPDLNRKFLARARTLGAIGSDFDINHALFYARKNNKLAHLPKTRRYTPRDSDAFEFASEIAVRYVQIQQQLRTDRRVSLDHIIEDPALAAEFDGVASKLAPGFTPLEYRWAALGLRKAARFSAIAKELKLPNLDDIGRTKSVKIAKVPEASGIYLFRDESSRSIFVGETDNLRRRIDTHFQYGGISGVPQWLYDVGSRPVHLSLVETRELNTSDRKALELGFVGSLRPVLNYAKGRSEAA